MTKPDLTIVRFLINGVLATLVHYSALRSIIALGMVQSIGLANGIAAIFGIASSYAGSHYFVFKSSSSVAQTLPGFLAVYGTVCVLHMGVLALWTDHWGLPYTPGFLIAMGMATLVTFASNRYFVFATIPRCRLERFAMRIIWTRSKLD